MQSARPAASVTRNVGNDVATGSSATMAKTCGSDGQRIGRPRDGTQTSTAGSTADLKPSQTTTSTSARRASSA